MLAQDNIGDNSNLPVAASVNVTIPVPVITGPPAVTPYQRPTITWTAVNGALQYEVWIGNETTNVKPFLVTVRQFNAFTDE